MSRYCVLALATAMMSISATGGATSRPFLDDITAVLREELPCFYITKPRGTVPPLSKLEIETVQVEGGAGVKWRAWFGTMPILPPVSPDSCLRYGKQVPNKREISATPLEFDKLYFAHMYTEFGTFRVYFCLKKDTQENTYLAQSNHEGGCATKPIDAKNKTSFWQKLFD